MASAVSMDKVLFKELMAQAGLPQVDYAAAREGDDRSALDRLGMPVFVKPARLGSSVGISKVERPDELPAALASAFEHDPLTIVEAFADGMEVECSVLGNHDPVASQPGEIVVNADWYDYEAKYQPGGMEPRSRRGCPSRCRSGSASWRLRSSSSWTARGWHGSTSSWSLEDVLRQRAQHDPRLHDHERLREALRGQRGAVRGAAGPPAGAGAGAPRAREALPLLAPQAELADVCLLARRQRDDPDEVVAEAAPPCRAGSWSSPRAWCASRPWSSP